MVSVINRYALDFTKAINMRIEEHLSKHLGLGGLVLIHHPIPGLNGGIYKKVKEPSVYCMVLRGDDFISSDGQFKMTWPEVGDYVVFPEDYLMKVLRWN